ncbi:endogenous retrovirus group 3 member 1 Env polyprotein-like [Trachemys scripta elegans]|uniref:endogenous retrovirus group 3 member 1 Env polyprotein-like n=1 Tax=Trachemys scripta elegans TaxID=31138 RepID=UPI00155361BC|nr:endogenous retrovirus group 3 member 1 Env polyprotein-like [Trachemys scripta elegans]
MKLLLISLFICFHHYYGWENRFLQLGETIAGSFNLSNCWVCGGPGDWNEWPWVAQPVPAKWWISNLSIVHKGTEVWDEDSSPWRLYSSEMGILCLNRTKQEGVYVGKSQCDWTLSLGFDCYDHPSCHTYDCSKYQGRWNQTHVKLTNHSWVQCSYQQHTGEGCKAVGQDGFFDALFLSCQRDNTDSKDHVVRWYQWAWQHSNGTRVTHFNHFWSTTNSPKFGCNCAWKEGAGAWKCDYCNPDGTSIVLGGPLEMGNSLYYEEPGPEDYPEAWDGPFANGQWALKGHYWICGQHAYRRLPPNWSGICYVGYIRPLFFLLPQIQGNKLGIKVYDDLIRERRSVDSALTAGSSQKWGAQEWPPERIIQHYGPATWNPNEWISGAREPIYNLNRIIRLQAILEIITNQTAAALDLLADQSTQMRNVLYQHHLVLDYLLAEEGGICAKLNESNCCLQIDDNGKAVKQLTKEMRKLAHVPVQAWGGWNTDWFPSWLPQLGWLREGLLLFILFITTLLSLACFAPCVVALVRRMANQIVRQRMMALYQPVKVEDWGP